MDKNMLYYISHPYTSFGDSKKNRIDSIMIETALTHFHKLHVINPIGFLPKLNDKEAMKRCRLFYDACDALILCEGWEKSKGCIIEYNWAIEDGKPIYIAKKCSGMFNYELLKYEAA